MKKYLPVFYLGLKNSLIFRANTLIRLLSQVVNLGISLWMWAALLPHGFLKMARYLLLTNTAALLFSTAPLYLLVNLIKSGQLTNFLIRPLSIYWYLLTDSLGGQAPLLLFYFALFLILANRPLTFIFLLIYLLICGFMFFNLMLVLGSLAFWLINLWPLQSGINALYLLFGGLYFPLTMLGQHIYAWLQYNPFSLVTDVPARLINCQSLTEFVPFTLATLGWLIVLFCLQHLLFRRGMCRYEGVGL